MIKNMVLMTLIVLIAGCAARQTPPPWKNKTPVEVCADVGIALCERNTQCGGEREGCYEFMNDYCSNVTKVTDVKRVYGQCIPGLQAMACDATLPASCNAIFDTE